MAANYSRLMCVMTKPGKLELTPGGARREGTRYTIEHFSEFPPIDSDAPGSPGGRGARRGWGGGAGSPPAPKHRSITAQTTQCHM